VAAIRSCTPRQSQSLRRAEQLAGSWPRRCLARAVARPGAPASRRLPRRSRQILQHPSQASAASSRTPSCARRSTGSLLNTKRTCRGATVSPQAVMGVAATLCWSSRRGSSGASSPHASASISADQPPWAGTSGSPSHWRTSSSWRRSHSATATPTSSSPSLIAAAAPICPKPLVQTPL
jgi:hypothetical protein